MSEYPLQFIAFYKILWVSVGSLLYGLGGIERKWLRRFVMPFWMGIGLWIFASWQGAFNIWQLLYPVLLCFSLHLGYSGDKK